MLTTVKLEGRTFLVLDNRARSVTELHGKNLESRKPVNSAMRAKVLAAAGVCPGRTMLPAARHPK